MRSPKKLSVEKERPSSPIYYLCTSRRPTLCQVRCCFTRSARLRLFADECLAGKRTNVLRPLKHSWNSACCRKISKKRGLANGLSDNNYMEARICSKYAMVNRYDNQNGRLGRRSPFRNRYFCPTIMKFQQAHVSLVLRPTARQTSWPPLSAASPFACRPRLRGRRIGRSGSRGGCRSEGRPSQSRTLEVGT